MVNNALNCNLLLKRRFFQVGDKIVSRLSIRVDRPMDFVQLKDQRGSLLRTDRQCIRLQLEVMESVIM